MSPRISVIIPVYNRANLLGETLDSIVSQTRPPDEIIVVDDGSTDDIACSVKRFGAAVTLVRQENAGPAAARNHGLRIATGDFIQFFDSDDIMSRNKIEVQLAALESSGADISYCPWVQAELIGREAYLKPIVLQQGPLPDDKAALHWYLRGWVTVFQTLMFRRRVLEDAGDYDKRLMPSEDSELLFRILSLNPKLIHTAEALVLYRVHPDTQISGGSSSSSLKRARDWLLYKQIVLEQLKANGAFSFFDVAKWRLETKLAELDVKSIDAGTYLTRILKAVSPFRLARRIWRKQRGVSFDAAFNEGLLTPMQAKQIHELGYVPITLHTGKLSGF